MKNWDRVRVVGIEKEDRGITGKQMFVVRIVSLNHETGQSSTRTWTTTLQKIQKPWVEHAAWLEQMKVVEAALIDTMSADGKAVFHSNPAERLDMVKTEALIRFAKAGVAARVELDAYDECDPGDAYARQEAFDALREKLGEIR